MICKFYLRKAKKKEKKGEFYSVYRDLEVYETQSYRYLFKMVEDIYKVIIGARLPLDVQRLILEFQLFDSTQ